METEAGSPDRAVKDRPNSVQWADHEWDAGLTRSKDLAGPMDTAKAVDTVKVEVTAKLKVEVTAKLKAVVTAKVVAMAKGKAKGSVTEDVVAW
ncbi:MAG: hypothetical protein JXM70_15500, partial [Pirellulales bacterium]|nr:hypothetical protein [Pirellulales bacterium]